MSAQRIHPNDAQRLQRAMEVFYLTGVPLSELQKSTASQFPYPLTKVALIPPERDELYRRIEQRFAGMLEQGFVEEVKTLFERGDLHAQLPSIRSVGYRQLWSYFAGERSLEHACELAKTATRQLAKRQMTWIRSDQNLVELAEEIDTRVAQILEIFGENTSI